MRGEDGAAVMIFGHLGDAVGGGLVAGVGLEGTPGDEQMVGLDSGLIGFDGEQVIVCLFAVRPDGCHEAGFAQTTGEGIVTMNGDRTHHRAQGKRIHEIASTINLPRAGGH